MVNCHVCGRKVHAAFYSVKVNSIYFPEGVIIRIHLVKSCLSDFAKSELTRQSAKIRAEEEEQQRRAILAVLSRTG